MMSSCASISLYQLSNVPASVFDVVIHTTCLLAIPGVGVAYLENPNINTGYGNHVVPPQQRDLPRAKA